MAGMGRKRTQIVCDHCDRVFTRMRDYEKHRYSAKGEKAHVCEICGKQYRSPLGLRVHLKGHSGEKPYQCEQCDKAFYSSAGLSYHRLTHSGERPFACDTCGKRFRLKAHLENHCVKHTGIKSHQCEICGLAFYTRKEMQGHQKVHLKGLAGEGAHRSKLSLACEVCGKVLHSQAGLHTHLKQHTGEKPFRCEACGKAYTNSAGLLYHQKTHSGEKNYKCDTCGRCFSSHGGLEVHKRTHTGEKPFSCDVCQLCFGSRSNLHAHQRSHTRAWLAAQHQVAPKPVSASALKMRKYREKLRANPSLAPPSLQSKPKWRPKKPETLRKYREKLKALDRLRTLPMKEESGSDGLVRSVLEMTGHSATRDNMEAASCQLVTLLPHHLVVVSASQGEATQAISEPAHHLETMKISQQGDSTPPHTAAVPRTSLAEEIPLPDVDTKAVVPVDPQLPSGLFDASREELKHSASSLQSLTLEHLDRKVVPNFVPAPSEFPHWGSYEPLPRSVGIEANGLMYRQPVEAGDHMAYTAQPSLSKPVATTTSAQELAPVDLRSLDIRTDGLPN